MKKFLYPTLALSALALASCSSEEPMNGNVADGPVTLKVVIPATMQSRSTLGDVIMATANNLQWSVYEVSTDGSTEPVLIYSDQKAAFTANASATATTETVTLNLGKGKTYQVAFYADNSENTFATYTDGVVNVNYANGATNDVQEDVFVGTSAVITVGVDVPSTVQLTRPFAQLNWGTNDLDEETVKHWVGNETSALEATVTVAGSVYSAYDVLGAKVSGDPVKTVTFKPAVVSDFSAYTETVTFPVPEYDLVAMNYVLVNDDAPSFDCTLAFNDGFQSVVVNNATMKQNFRTNIYGALLTNPTEFNVEIAPAFQTPDNDVEYLAPAFVPTEKEEVAISTDGVATVTNPAQFNWILTEITSQNYRGQDLTVNVATDINFNGVDWTPVNKKSNSDTGHTIKFDFNGSTFYGLNAPLFNELHGAVSNLRLVGSTISTTDNKYGIVGALACQVYATLDNVVVENCTINCSDNMVQVGGIAGLYANGNATNCSVKNVVINNAAASADREAGGMFGAMNADGSSIRTLTNCSATGVSIPGATASTSFGAYVGAAYGITLNLVDCTATDCNPSALVGKTSGATVNQ